MENKDSSDESGEMICSELDVPIITSEALEPVITTFLSAITDDQWVILADGKITSGTFTRLYKMCSETVRVISSEVLDVVEPQVQNWMFIHATQGGHNMKHRNYYSVTEEDIKASIGNSFDRCFGEVTGIPQKRSNESIILLELFAAEVKKRVNQSLAGLSSAGQSTSCPQIESIDSETFNDNYYDTSEMVYQVATILNYLLRDDTESPSYQHTVSSMDFSSNQGIVDIERFSLEERCTDDPTMCPLPSDVKSFAKATEKKNLGDLILEDCSSTSPESTGSIQQVSVASSDVASEEGGTSPSKEQRLNKPSGKNRSFGHKVRTFFNRKTNKVAPACDLNTSVSHSSAEDATIMRTVPNMQRSDSQSEETLVNFSSSELLNSSPKKTMSFGHRLRTFLSSKTSKVTPGCNLNTSENQGSPCSVSSNTLCPDEITEVEEFCSKDSVTCDKQSAIMRILSSAGKILMKPFICCKSK